MENASKALIIAGAILISILLIAVSVYIYNASQDTITGAGSSMNQQARDAYNSKFTSYVKDNASATDVRALIDNIISSNNENVNQTGKFVYIETSITWDNRSTTPEGDNGLGNSSLLEGGNDDKAVSNVAANMSKLKAKINSGKRYNVSAEYSSGLIVKIGIEEA